MGKQLLVVGPSAAASRAFPNQLCPGLSAVPLCVMKLTGTTGRKDRSVTDAIDNPELLGNLAQVTAPEETTQEEVQESFLKLNNNKVRGPLV